MIINDRSFARGGATAMALLSARLFVEAGIPVTYLTGDQGDDVQFRHIGAEILSIGATHIMQSGKLAAFRNGLYLPTSRGALKDWIAANDEPSVIYHVHSWSKILSPSIFAALTPVARRTIIHAHDFFMVCPNGGFMNYRREVPCDLVAMSPACLTTNCDKRSYAEKIWRVGRHVLLRRLIDLTKAGTNVLLVHAAMVPFFRRAGVPEENLHTLRNPVTLPPSSRVPAEANRMIYFIGRLDPEKGALDAAAAARMAGLPVTIIGEGPQAAQIAAAYPDVALAGWCSQAQVAEHLAAARLVVVPSRWRETFGLIIIEALSRGIPVIVSDKALIAADVAASGAGLAINTSDIALFAATLRHLGKDDAAVKAMSEAALVAAARLAMTPAAWRDAMLAHYRAVLARTPSTSR